MKAAVLEEIGRMVVKEVPTPGVEEGCLLVRVRACAVCGSDLRILRHGNPRVRPPQVIGHEIAGEVAEVGVGVEGFKIGDRVATGADVPCGVCPFCRQGMGNVCPINYALGYQFPGGFAEYVLLNQTTLRYGPVHHIPEGLDYPLATLAEPLACCLNGLERSQLRPGDTVVVIGAGPAGCLLAMAAKALGAAKVILAQRSRPRLEMARMTGADVLVLTSEEDLEERVMEETSGLGAEVVVVACASPEVQAQALRLVKNRGHVNLFAGLPPGTPPIPLETNLVHYKECYVHGSHGSLPRHHRAALELLAAGRIKPAGLITHTFPLEAILEAFRVVEERRGMKVVVTP